MAQKYNATKYQINTQTDVKLNTECYRNWCLVKKVKSSNGEIPHDLNRRKLVHEKRVNI